MEPFDKEKRCPKCGGKADYKYLNGYELRYRCKPEDGVDTIRIEAMKRTCADCGYIWHEGLI